MPENLSFMEQEANKHAEKMAEAKRIDEMVALCEREKKETGEFPDSGLELKQLEGILEKMFEDYEIAHSTDYLLSIETEDQAVKDPKRALAKADLNDIVEMLNALGQLGRSAAELAPAWAKYKPLSQAVGMINNKLVDHTR